MENPSITIFRLSDGQILRRVTCQDIDVHLQIGDGEGYVNGDYDDSKYKIQNGVAVLIPPVAPPAFNLASAIEKKINDLNNLYDQANTGTFKYLNVVYNGDTIAQGNINAIANYINQFNDFPAAFQKAWIAADGSVLSMPTPADFWPFYQAFVAQGVWNINHFTELKNQVLALPSTATQSDIDAIVW